MAKIQIIMAVTLDGFLPRKEEALMQKGQGEYTTWLSILAGGSYHSYLSFIRSDGPDGCGTQIR